MLFVSNRNSQIWEKMNQVALFLDKVSSNYCRSSMWISLLWGELQFSRRNVGMRSAVAASSQLYAELACRSSALITLGELRAGPDHGEPFAHMKLLSLLPWRAYGKMIHSLSHISLEEDSSYRRASLPMIYNHLA